MTPRQLKRLHLDSVDTPTSPQHGIAGISEVISEGPAGSQVDSLEYSPGSPWGASTWLTPSTPGSPKHGPLGSARIGKRGSGPKGLLPIVPKVPPQRVDPGKKAHGCLALAPLTRALRNARLARARVPSVRAYGWLEGEPQGSSSELTASQGGRRGSELTTPRHGSKTTPGTPASGTAPGRARSMTGLTAETADEGDPVDSRHQTPEMTSFEKARRASFDVSIPWSEEVVRSVFTRFIKGDDKEVNVEDVTNVLHYLGVRAEESQVLGIVKDITPYASVSWDEFTDFLARWRALDMQTLYEQFDTADVDRNGYLDTTELHELMQLSGYSPTVAATLEAMETIDLNGDQMITFSEFERLREHLRKTKGFLKEEAAEMGQLFDRVATIEVNGERRLPVDELWRIRCYLGYSASKEDLAKIVAKVDTSGHGEITFDELLQVARGMQDVELQAIRKVVGKYQAPHQKAAEVFMTHRGDREKPKDTLVTKSPKDLGKYVRTKTRVKISPFTQPELMPIRCLEAALTDLGYFASSEAVQEVTEMMLEKESLSNEDVISYIEVADFLRAFRLVEGFTKAETAELLECFAREQCISVAGCDDDRLDALEFGRVLRYYGISKNMQEVRRLIDSVDFSGDQQLETHEFLKLMRQLLQDEALERRSVFQQLAIALTNKVFVSSLPDAIKMITGAAPDPVMFKQVVREALDGKDSALTLNEFEAFCRRYRKVLTASVQNTSGFVPSEVERLQETFAHYNQNGTGILEDSELRLLIHDLMPEAMLSYEGKQDMRKMLAELADLGQDSSLLQSERPVVPTHSSRDMTETTSRGRAQDPKPMLDFKNFLALMRRYYDMRDEKDVTREMQAIQATGFPHEAVEAYRQIFLEHVDSTGDLALPMLIHMLGNIGDIKQHEVCELEDMLIALSPEKRNVARFPQFLLLMQQVTELNLFGLNDTARKVLSSRR